jgi:hypothetical protein
MYTKEQDPFFDPPDQPPFEQQGPIQILDEPQQLQECESFGWIWELSENGGIIMTERSGRFRFSQRDILSGVPAKDREVTFSAGSTGAYQRGLPFAARTSTG